MSQKRVKFAPDTSAVENGPPHILIWAPTGEFDLSPEPAARDKSQKSHTAAAGIDFGRLAYSDELVAETDDASALGHQHEDEDDCSESTLRDTGTAATAGPLNETLVAGDVDIDGHGDLLDDVQPDYDARDHTPAHPSIFGLRTPGIDEHDTDHIKSQASPLPSEAVNTDRGEWDWNASDRKHQIQTDTSGQFLGDSPTNKKSFADLLTDAMIYKSGRLDTRFLPRGELERLVNVVAVERELRDSVRMDSFDGRSMHSWARQICGELDSSGAGTSQRGENGTAKQQPKTYRKIFAILQTGSVPLECIFELLEEGISDQDLPLRPLDPSRPFKWFVVSPFFARADNNDVQRYPLEDEDVLPFTYDSRDVGWARGKPSFLERGGFGEVFKVRIHRDHHNFHHELGQPEELEFAVKKLFSRDGEDWKKEIEILKRFSSNAHPHLISLLATYEHQKSVHLIFHWADADLQRYWKELYPRPSMNRRFVGWFLRQCVGIASGIVAIHRHDTSSAKKPAQPCNQTADPTTLVAEENECINDALYGRHGDIKPRNILWFKNAPDEDRMGTLVITDFGVAEMNSIHSRSGKSNRELTFTRTYCAPEAHIHGRGIRRSYDIWTLGCLYLEFLTWMLGGSRLVDEFTQARLKREKAFEKHGLSLDWFFELETAPNGTIVGARIKSEVTDFIKNLHSHAACTEFVHDFLDLIQNHLLIVETQDLERHRFTSQQVCSELSGFQSKLQSNQAYGLEPKPWGPDGRPGASIKASQSLQAAPQGNICLNALSKRSTF